MLKNKKHTIVKKQRKEKLPDVKNADIQVEKLNGFRDRISVSLGLDIEVKKYELKAKPFISYASDVRDGETVEQAKERVLNLVMKEITKIKNEIVKARKG